ncbi:MAG: glycosyltransferase [Pseudomonadota bacterium]
MEHETTSGARTPAPPRSPPAPGAVDVAAYAFLLRHGLPRTSLERACAAATRSGSHPHQVLAAQGTLSAHAYAAQLATHLGLRLATPSELIATPRTPGSPSPTTPQFSPTALSAGSAEGWQSLSAQPFEVRARLPDGRHHEVWDAQAFSPGALAALLRLRHGRREPAPFLASRPALDACRLHALQPQMVHEAGEGLRRRMPHQSAAHGLTWMQGSVLLMLLCAFIAVVVARPAVALPALSLSLTLVFAAIVWLRVAALVHFVATGAPEQHTRSPPLADHQLPTYSVLVALYDEAEAVPGLIAAMGALDYPPEKLEVLALIEADDHATAAALAQVTLPPRLSVVVVPPGQPRTKPRALNYGLQLARGALTVIYDAEDVPQPDQLRRAAAQFADAASDVVCLQARLNTYNPNASFFARQFTLEYSSLFDALLPFIAQVRWPVLLGGTSNHFPTAWLRRIGAWDPHNVTEDADLGVRLARAGLRAQALASTTWEEAPECWSTWLPQRTRWLKGWMQTYGVHMRHPLRLLGDLGLWGFIGLQLQMAGLIAAALLHPLVYIAVPLWAWWVWGEGSLDGFVATPSFAALVLGNVGAGLIAGIGLAWLAVIRRGRGWLVPAVWAMPLYWLMISLAAYRAVGQLISAPHRWEKTPHRGRPRVMPPHVMPPNRPR